MVNIWPIISHLLGSCCPLCGQPGEGLCPPCRDALPRNDRSCRRCALPLPVDACETLLCAACQQRPPPFDRVIAPLRYATPVDDLVSRFKYHGRLPLARTFAALVWAAIDDRSSDERPTLLLPVPVHARGLRERGFNQAAELARLLARHSGTRWSAGRLARVRHGQHQRGLTRRQRQRNLRGAFECLGPVPRHVAVIDDVVTTGATVSEISHLLRRNGAERVEVWSVARTPRD